MDIWCQRRIIFFARTALGSIQYRSVRMVSFYGTTGLIHSEGSAPVLNALARPY